MTRLPQTLSFRLTLWYATAFVLFLAAAFTVLFVSVNTIFDKRFNTDLVEDIVDFGQLYAESGLKGVQQEMAREVVGEADRVFLRLLDSQGKQTFSTDLSAWEGLQTDMDVITLLKNNPSPVIQTLEFDSQDYPTKIIYGLIAPDLILHIGETTEEKSEIMDLLFVIFTVMFVVVTPFASYIGWLMARQAARGIEEVSRTAVLIESGHLDKRVSVKARDREIILLTSAFNAMLDRVRDLVTELREMTDNIAHDLRSPLARIRAMAELSLSKDRTIENHQRAASNTIEECDRLLQMINATLDVAEAEAGISDAVSQEINISEITRDACELFEPVAEEKGIELSCVVGSGCQTYGNVQYLQRMLANLIDNALKYTPANGRVNVDLACTPQRIKISVSDTGDGIAPEDQERIFDRFYRCEKSRTQDGCGMGLSFSQAVARAHGGGITVVSRPGAGTAFTISLPIKKG